MHVAIILRDVEKLEEVLAQQIPAVVFGHSHDECLPGRKSGLFSDLKMKIEGTVF